MIRAIRLTSLFCLAALLAVRANAISLSQSLDRSAIAYEGKATFEITITWQGNQAAFRFDRPLQPALDKLKVQQFSTTISSTGTGPNEVSTKKFVYSVMPTGSGTGRIEPMVIHYLSWPDSLPGELVTEAMTVNIAAAKPKPSSKNPLSGLPLMGIIAVWVVIAGGVGTGVLLFVRSRKRKPKEIIKTPVEIFQEKLTALSAEAGSDLKRFQTGLYKLLVWFLNAHYKINVSNQSAEEIARGIEAADMPAAHKEKLCGWLLRAEREKFSPLPPAPGETIRLEAEIRQFFEQIQSRG